MPTQPEAVHVVTLWDGDDTTGVWVFADFDDAQAFKQVSEEAGKKAVYDEQIIIDRADAAEFIDAAREEA